MISYLSGKIILEKDNFVILLVNGIGYEVFLSSETMLKIADKKDNLNLFCHLDVTERSLKIFGFLSYEEMELFKIVRAISGIGPKVALEISGVGSLQKAKEQIDKGVFLEGIVGVGKKRAQKIILELSGKLKKNDSKKSIDNETLQALLGLGFLKAQAKEALSSLEDGLTQEERIKKALLFLEK